MKLTRITIPARSVELAGLLYTPREDRASVCVVVSHGFTASKESVDLLASYLAMRGYPALTFDFRGHKLGGSMGELRHAEQVLEDLTAAAAFASRHFRQDRCILAGHSMGALASLLTAAGMPEAAGVAAIATGLQPSRGFQQPVGIAMLSQRSDYVSGADPMTILEEFDRLAASWTGIGDRPALFVAAKSDAVVKPGRVREISLRAGSRSEYVEIEGSHLEAPHRARGAVAAWLDAWFTPGATSSD